MTAHMCQRAVGFVGASMFVFTLFHGLSGCSGGKGGNAGGGGGNNGGGGNGGGFVQTTFSATFNRKLDVLFMIDNSPSMAPLQAKLVAQIPAFFNVLKSLPTGLGNQTGLPDLQVAVISSDTGPGKYDLPDRHCRFTGDGGRFQSFPRGACATPPLPADQHFLASSMNQTIKNYTGDIADAFACIAPLGDQGCDFEGQLKSVRWAVDPINPAVENVGFLRPDAYLAVILVTNEDDCSVADDSDLFDPTAAGLTTYGPLKSFRCNQFGHLCNVGGTLQAPARGAAASNLQGCVANDTSTSKLTRVGEEVAFLKSLKTNPAQLFVAAITGPSTPYSLAPDTDGDQSVVHSCTQNATEYADPAVRIQNWIEGFGNHGLMQTICGNSFAPPLMLIANEVAKLLGPPCLFSTSLVDLDSTMSGVQPDCQVTDQYVDDQTKIIRTTTIPSCAANGGSSPCWSLLPDPACASDSLLANINRGANPVFPPGLTTTLSCKICIPGVEKPGCP